jgi:hypothetical protein
MPKRHASQRSEISPPAFAIDGQLLRLLPRAGASLRHPHVRLPVLRSDPDGYYLELRLEANPQETSELGLTRRIWLEGLTPPEWEALQAEFEQVDWTQCQRQGVSAGLATLHDRRLERILTGLLTFLNPRQMGLVLHLYRLAAQQQQDALVTVRSNDLLQELGYSRTKDGGFASKLRSQLHRDLMALHRTEMVYPPITAKGAIGTKVKVKTVLRIQDYQIANAPRSFDPVQAADYTYELADRYTVSLEFFEGLSRNRDCVYLAGDWDITQKLGANAKNDYKTRLLLYLASRLRWDIPVDQEYLILSKQSVFRNLELVGTNGSRNNQIFWRTVEELKATHYLLGAQELPGKKKINSIQFQINSEKLRCG